MRAQYMRARSALSMGRSGARVAGELALAFGFSTALAFIACLFMATEAYARASENAPCASIGAQNTLGGVNSDQCASYRFLEAFIEPSATGGNADAQKWSRS